MSAPPSDSGPPASLAVNVNAGTASAPVEFGELIVNIRQPDGTIVRERFIRAGVQRSAPVIVRGEDSDGAPSDVELSHTVDYVMFDEEPERDEGGMDAAGAWDEEITLSMAGDEEVPAPQLRPRVLSTDAPPADGASLRLVRGSSPPGMAGAEQWGDEETETIASADEWSEAKTAYDKTLGGEAPSWSPGEPIAADEAWEDKSTQVVPEQHKAAMSDRRHTSWPNGTELRTERARYVLVSTLGASNHAESHLAYEIMPDSVPRAIAVKRLLAEPGTNWNARRFRFMNRAKLGAELRHLHLMSVLDRGEFEGVPFLVREVVDGLNLRALAAFSERKIKLGVVCEIARQIVDALSYLHSAVDVSGKARNLVHGEVSASTVTIGRDGIAKLSEAGASPISEVTILGCAPPEQVAGRRLDGRSDLFSLGIVLVEMISGSPLAPSGKLDFKGLQDEVKARCDSRTDIPEELPGLLLSMTALDPADRPARTETVVELLEDIIELMGGAPDLSDELEPLFRRARPGLVDASGGFKSVPPARSAPSFPPGSFVPPPGVIADSMPPGTLAGRGETREMQLPLPEPGRSGALSGRAFDSIPTHHRIVDQPQTTMPPPVDPVEQPTVDLVPGMTIPPETSGPGHTMDMTNPPPDVVSALSQADYLQPQLQTAGPAATDEPEADVDDAVRAYLSEPADVSSALADATVDPFAMPSSTPISEMPAEIPGIAQSMPVSVEALEINTADIAESVVADLAQYAESKNQVLPESVRQSGEHNIAKAAETRVIDESGEILTTAANAPSPETPPAASAPPLAASKVPEPLNSKAPAPLVSQDAQTSESAKSEPTIIKGTPVPPPVVVATQAPPKITGAKPEVVDLRKPQIATPSKPPQKSGNQTMQIFLLIIAVLIASVIFLIVKFLNPQ